MKYYHITFLFALLLPILSYSQTLEKITIKKATLSLVGTWEVSNNYNIHEKFTWEFTTDSLFSILKITSLDDLELHADEKGTWNYTNDTLTITVTGEMDKHGIRKLYPKPQTVVFSVSFGSEFVLLTGIKPVTTISGKQESTVFRLKRK
jgi:hypothetical protein